MGHQDQFLNCFWWFDATQLPSRNIWVQKPWNIYSKNNESSTNAGPEPAKFNLDNVSDPHFLRKDFQHCIQDVLSNIPSSPWSMNGEITPQVLNWPWCATPSLHKMPLVTCHFSSSFHVDCELWKSNKMYFSSLFPQSSIHSKYFQNSFLCHSSMKSE